MKKFALIATATTALVCAVSLMATPGEAKTKKKPAKPAEMGQTWAHPAGYHDLGGPTKNGKECWKDRDAWTNIGQGYWGKC